MLINELPDDCLMAIFEYVNDLDDLINCYKVCVGWSYLIAKRARKVKYLLEDPHQTADNNRCGDDSADYSDIQYLFDCVYYQGKDNIDVACLNKLFPNLKIFEFTDGFQNKVKKVDIVSFVKNHESLRGIIDSEEDPLEEYCNELEMLSCSSVESSKIPNGSKIKQLLILGCDCLGDVERYAHDFPNLEILRMFIRPTGNYNKLRVPVFEKLKILVLYSQDTFSYGNKFYGFQLMDSCPNLQSAHITMDSNPFFVDETLKHECLQDLVIEFLGNQRVNWNYLKKLLMKYPNLKHLALRNLRGMKFEHIKRLAHILPNLVLLHITSWDHCIMCTTTGRGVGTVDDYSQRCKQSSKFYVKDDRLQKPLSTLSTKHEEISRGFDFMKHFFLKCNFELPRFLIPIDY